MPSISPFGGLTSLNSLQGAGSGTPASTGMPSLSGLTGGGTPSLGGLTGGSNPLAGLTGGGASSLGGLGGASGIGGGAPGLDAASLQKAGVSSSTLMLMSQINTMMASVMTGLMAFMQQVMASAAQRKQQQPTPGATPGDPGASPGAASTPTPGAGGGGKPKPGASSSSPTGSSSSSSGKKGGLTSLGIGDYQLNSAAAEAFKKANAEYKAKYGKDIPVLSAHRSPSHNASVGGSPTSNHLDGNAIDVNFADWQKVKPIIEKYGFDQLGGTYNGKSEDNHFDFKG